MGRSNVLPVTARVLLSIALALAVGCSETPASSSGDLGSPATIGDPSGTAEAPAPAPAATPTPEGPRPIIVATVLGETGVMDALDGPALAGVVAEIEHLNENGGVLGRKLEIVRFDTNSRVSIAKRTMQRLVEDPPDLVIVSCDVDFSRPTLEVAEAAGLVTISPCADDAGYATGAWGPRNFTLGAPAGDRGAIAAEEAFALYGSTAMVLRDVTSPEALAFCDGFEQAFRELGGSVSYRDEFSYDTLEPMLDRLAERASQTSFIVVCSHVPGHGDAAPSIIVNVRTLGFLAPIVSGIGVDEPTWFRDVPVLGELTFVSWGSVHGNDPDDRINDLIRRANSDRETPAAGATTILGAESVEAWARAAEAVRTVEPGPVASALGAFSDESFSTGKISFLAGARMDPDRVYRVLQFVDGELRVIDVREVERG